MTESILWAIVVGWVGGMVTFVVGILSLYVYLARQDANSCRLKTDRETSDYDSGYIPRRFRERGRGVETEKPTIEDIGFGHIPYKVRQQVCDDE